MQSLYSNYSRFLQGYCGNNMTALVPVKYPWRVREKSTSTKAQIQYQNTQSSASIFRRLNYSGFLYMPRWYSILSAVSYRSLGNPIVNTLASDKVANSIAPISLISNWYRYVLISICSFKLMNTIQIFCKNVLVYRDKTNVYITLCLVSEKLENGIFLYANAWLYVPV